MLKYDERTYTFTDRRHYGEIQIGDKPPTWTQLVNYNRAVYDRHIGEPSPIPVSADVWSESDDVAENLEYMLRPFLLHEVSIKWSDLVDNQAIDGYEPYHGIQEETDLGT